MKTIIITLLLALSLGCASPYLPQARALTQAYQNGEISANDYYAQMTNLEALDLQRRQNISNAWFNFATGMQNQQYLNQMNRPQTIYLYNR